jgi:nitrogenase molybdenum-cofactor synthesis protein NifE
VFVYATCIAGVIGDDVEAVCREAEEKHSIRAIPVKAPGFSGTKSQGYRMACDAIFRLILPHKDEERIEGVNILGDFNLAGEAWIVRSYMERLGIPVVGVATGDSSYESLIKMPRARLYLVQCAGSMNYLAKRMEEELGIPYVKVSFFGSEDIARSLADVAKAFGGERAQALAAELIEEKRRETEPVLLRYREALEGKKAAIFVGGGFKAVSLVRQFAAMGIKTVVVGTQTGQPEDYEMLGQLTGPDAVVLDDATPSELEHFMREKGADILVGGVKERPLAYKLAIAFCDHNHERKRALAGYEGLENFAREIHLSMNSPVWSLAEGDGI